MTLATVTRYSSSHSTVLKYSASHSTLFNVLKHGAGTRYTAVTALHMASAVNILQLKHTAVTVRQCSVVTVYTAVTAYSAMSAVLWPALCTVVSAVLYVQYCKCSAVSSVK